MKRLAALLVLAACKQTPSVVVDGGAAPIAVADASVDAGTTATVDDLLYETDAKITVSSRVDNPRDFPEHLVDGKAQTAWNGKTGDLHAWIEVVVPPAATATTISLTCGFDKKDLFEKNHRISKVAISRDGKKVKEATLDTNKRTSQSIVIDDPKPGGTYRIEVLETLPGTKKDWNEIVVSDFAVYGHAGTARIGARLPTVNVAPGSAPAPKIAPPGEASTPLRRTGPSIKAICAQWAVDIQKEVEKFDPTAKANPVCKEIPPPKVTGSTPEWKSFHAIHFEWFASVTTNNSDWLAIEKKDGSFVVGPEYAWKSDMGCMSIPDFVSAAFEVRGDQLLESQTWIRHLYEYNDEGPLREDGGEVWVDSTSCAVSSLVCGERRELQKHVIPQGEIPPLMKNGSPPVFP